MSRINTNTASLLAGRQLATSQSKLQQSLERLSSGLRINRGADDPAGLIISQNLQSEVEGVQQAINNSQRAVNVLATTEGALNEVANLLNDIQSKVVEAANTGAVSDDEIKANQLQIDSAVESITRIANTTSFGGRKLLNGSLGYVTSGINATNLTDVQLHGVTFGTANYVPVTVSVTQSAQHGELQFATSAVTQNVTIEIAGSRGVNTLSLLAGTTASAILGAINLVSDSTGVSASLINPLVATSGIRILSKDFGSSSFVQVHELGTTVGAFQTQDAAGALVSRDIGRDVSATINGAQSLGKGLSLSLNTSGLSLDLSITQAFNTVGTTSFAVTGGGANFQLGPGVDSNQQVNIGVQSTAASRLGNASIGYLSDITSGGQYSLVNGQASKAADILSEAINQVSVLRGRLGAFEKNTLDTNVNQLGITLENLSSAESTIRDLDFAQETSNLTKQQILVQAGTSILGVANSTPQTVLSLLK
ncbi:MAG TPA: flagellin [Phycisphaerae bacterium]|nr:flagellin [Phycisphaerae bacterium]